MSRFLTILLTFGLLGGATRVGHAEDIKAIVKRVESGTLVPNVQAQIKMIVQEPDGSKKVRELTLLRKSEAGVSQTLLRVEKPIEMKGVALLTVAKGSPGSSLSEEQYLYVPSEKKTRRLIGAKRKAMFLDGEIAFEDFTIFMYRGMNNRVMRDNGRVLQIESKTPPKHETSYSKIYSWVGRPNYRIQRVALYDKKGKLLKRAVFKKFEKVDGKFWQAHDIQMNNIQTGRKTTLQILKLSTKPIAPNEVSPNHLGK